MPCKTQILTVFAATSCALLLAAGALAAPASTQSRAEISLFQAVNAARVAHGLSPLSVDATLTRAARSHSLQMLRAGTFAHGDFAGRMAAFHARGPVLGENLAWGSGSYAAATTVVQEWLASPEHRANLLRPTFTRIGIGTTQGRFLGNGGSTVVTADFAGR